MRKELKELIDSAKEYIDVRPAFRSKPIGAPYSTSRLEQQIQIAAEDRLKIAIYAASIAKEE